jgi:hypothetical protein
VANAYKHAGPLRDKHPIASDSDILAAGAGLWKRWLRHRQIWRG